MIPAVYRWVSLCPPFAPDRLSWWSKASILEGSTWVLKLLFENFTYNLSTPRGGGNLATLPRWSQVCCRSALMTTFSSRTDVRGYSECFCNHGIYTIHGYIWILVFLLHSSYLRCSGNMEIWWYDDNVSQWILCDIGHFANSCGYSTVFARSRQYHPGTIASSFTDMNHQHSAIVSWSPT